MSRVITPITLPSLGATVNSPSAFNMASRRAPAKKLPVVVLAPIRTDEVVYGFGRINDKGRIAAAEVMPVLGWAIGSSLECRVADGRVIVRPHPEGTIRVLDLMRLRLPVNVRRRCRLSAGTGLPLAADPSANELIIVPPVVLDHLLRPRDAGEAGDE